MPAGQKTTKLEISSICEWGPPKKVPSAKGPRILRVAPPTTRFRSLMKHNKPAAQAAGLGWGKDPKTGEWQACWWRPDTKSTEKALKRYRESFSHQTDLELPCAEPYKPYGYQIIGADYTLRHKRCLLADDMGLGKLAVMSELLPTPTDQGFTRMGDIKVGDKVFGSDGKPTEVIGVYPQGVKAIYRMTFADGSYSDCGLEHLWNVTDSNHRRREKRHGNGWMTLSTEQIMKRGIMRPTASGPQPKFWIPRQGKVAYPERQYDLDPYFVGVMIGDGTYCGTQAVAYLGDEDKEDIKPLIPEPMSRRKAPGCERQNYPATMLRRLNAIGLTAKGRDKSIPKPYLIGSIEQRTELLRGLMDTDGSCAKNRTVFHTRAPQLAKDVKQLVDSLGGFATIREYSRDDKGPDGGVDIQVRIEVDFCPFHVKRKAAQWKPQSAMRQSKRGIVSIEHIGDEEAQCIAVDAPDRLYLTTQGYIVTHNTIQTILVTNADTSIMDAVIVCPATLKINWEREFRKFGTRDLEIHHCNGESKQNVKMELMRQGRKSTKLRVWIINYDILTAWKEFMHAKTWDLVALDESHTIKNTQSKRTHVIRGKWSSAARKWEGETKARYRMCLSGTPLENDATELITSLQWLGVMQQFPRFKERYGEGQNRVELNKKLRTICMIRRMKSEVLKDLPGKVRSVIEVTPDSDALQALREAEAEIAPQIEKRMRELQSGDKSQEDIDKALEKLQKGSFGVPFEEIARIRKLTGEAKVEVAANHIAELHESLAGKPIIAFCHHIDSVMVPLKAELENKGLRVGTICGQDSRDRKQAVVDAFQAGELDVCLGQIRSAGVGLTLTKSSHVVFVEFDWVPSRMVQCEDRSCRIGQENVVTVHILALLNSLDARMAELVASKAETSRDILDVNHDPERDNPTPESQPEPKPVVPRKIEIDQKTAKKLDTESARQEAWDAIPTALTEEQLTELQQRLQRVATACDGAREIDGMGFSKLDTRKGRILAFGMPNFWDSHDIKMAQFLTRKYRGQCGLPGWMEAKS